MSNTDYFNIWESANKIIAEKDAEIARLKYHLRFTNTSLGSMLSDPNTYRTEGFIDDRLWELLETHCAKNKELLAFKPTEPVKEGG